MSSDALITYNTLDKNRLTPMMLQYLEQKERCPDAILLFRLGDFYEMFFDDAVTVSKVLELALTGRDCGLDSRAPMCGVPHHASLSYIQKLVSHGYKVAICDQVEDPAQAKGIVKRAITRILTPGTIIDPASLDEKRNNYLVSICKIGMQFGIAAADITTGQFEATQLVMGNTQAQLFNLLSRYMPSEIICNNNFRKSTIFEWITTQMSIPVTERNNSDFSSEKNSRISMDNSSQSMESEGRQLIYSAVNALLMYVDESQQSTVTHLKPIRIFHIDETMELDVSTRSNLELVQTIRNRSKRGSLLWAIDRTQTSMGGRLLRRWLDQPLISAEEINNRLEAVQEAKDSFIVRQELMEALSGIADLERISSRISLESVNPRDLLSVRNTLRKLPYIIDRASQFSKGILSDAIHSIDDLHDICILLDHSISDDAPIAINDGGIIRQGYSKDVDHLRTAAFDAKSILLKLESDEKEKTGIRNLKVGYNRVFGYYIEVTKSNIDSVPDRYVRKQTLANAERYITDDLKNVEDSILGAQQRLITLEHELFCKIRSDISVQSSRLFSTADALAIIDVIMSLAEQAERENYVRPIVDNSQELVVEEGRHPVVEKMLPSNEFVPNNANMNEDDRRIMILTGPNMAGKSTYMRQIALIVLLAQIGSFVPAKFARIGVVDRIFTRIGASDDISSGQSTFMVEMNEVSTILRNATRRSMLLLDEIGRGTSTYDGLSIAWSILEFLSDRSVMFARTIFATHYHELNMLEERIPGVFTSHIEVEEKDGKVLFLHKISNGGTDNSYGIEVAKLAGVPTDVINRAKILLRELERTKIMHIDPIGKSGDINEIDMHSDLPMRGQMELNATSHSFVKTDPLRTELASTDITGLTPLEAMNLLYALINKAQKND